MKGIQRFIGLIAAGVFAVMLGSIAGSSTGAPVPAPPFARGTTWTQRLTMVPVDGRRRVGTLTQTFGGQANYRGRVMYYFDTSSTLAPGTVERGYAEWDGAHFGEVAIVTTDPRHTVSEIIFDKAMAMGVPAEASGNALVFVNGTQTATLGWSYRSVPHEKVKVTVPAGTFQTTRWEANVKLGQIDTLLSIYNVGIMAVRRDSKDYVNGSLASTTTMELVSGPVR